MKDSFISDIIKFYANVRISNNKHFQITMAQESRSHPDVLNPCRRLGPALFILNPWRAVASEQVPALISLGRRVTRILSELSLSTSLRQNHQVSLLQVRILLHPETTSSSTCPTRSSPKASNCTPGTCTSSTSTVAWTKFYQLSSPLTSTTSKPTTNSTTNST